MISKFYLLTFISLCLFLHGIHADVPCKIDGTAYICPSVLSVLDRWGVEFRHYDTQLLLGYDSINSVGASINKLLNYDLPYLQAYFNGANSNNSKIPTTFPVGIEIVSYPQYNFTYALTFLFLPVAYQRIALPATNDTDIIVSDLLTPGRMDPIVLQFNVQYPTDQQIASYLAQLQSICQQHGQGYGLYESVYITYLTKDTITWPNEVWVFPEGSDYLKQRRKAMKEIAKEQGINLDIE